MGRSKKGGAARRSADTRFVEGYEATINPQSARANTTKAHTAPGTPSTLQFSSMRRVPRAPRVPGGTRVPSVPNVPT